VKDSEKKIPQEKVLREHRSGAPHFTADQGGVVRHYCTNTPPQGEVVGAVLRPGDSVTVQIPLPGVGAPSSPTRTSTGPAQVASDAYRSGWVAIDWTRNGQGKPS
jgi:hypothetical protein